MTEATASTSLDSAQSRDTFLNTSPSRLTSRWALVMVLLFSAAVYLPFLDSTRTLTRHEVFITQPALQMLNDGDWLVPHYTNRIWIQKPPLISWITAGLFKLTGGFSAGVARLPAAVSAIGLCAVITVLTTRFYGPLAGLLAGLVQATSVYTFTQGRLGEVDMSFALFLGGAMATLAWYWGRGRGGSSVEDKCDGNKSGRPYHLPFRAVLLFHVLAGLAVMTKGPLAIVLLGGTVLAFCAMRHEREPSKVLLRAIGAMIVLAIVLAALNRGPVAVLLLVAAAVVFCVRCGNFQPLRAVLWTPAVLVFFAVVGPWFIAVAMRLGRPAFREWYYDSIGRAGGEQHHLGTDPIYYYLGHILWVMLPWTILLLVPSRKEAYQPTGRPRELRDFWPPMLVVCARRVVEIVRQPQAGFQQFLLCWFGAGLLLLSMSAFKHQHYMFPVLPPLSIFAGKWLADHAAYVDRRAYTVYRVGFSIGLILLGFVSAVIMPRQDCDRLTVQFLKESMPKVPADAPLYLIGLGQIAAYPHVTHSWHYLDNLPDVQTAADSANDHTIWVLTIPMYASEAENAGMTFQQVAAEPLRRKRSQKEILLLGRLTLAPTLTSQPTTSTFAP